MNPATTSLNRATATDAYLDRLLGEVPERAVKVVEDHTQRMKEVLRNRRNLGQGLGQWPRWGAGPAPFTPADRTVKSNKSFAYWRMERKGKYGYQLINSAGKPWNGENYSYPLALANGGPWPAKVRQAVDNGTATRLIKVGGKIFSTQMPKGLNPWIRRKKREMEKDILKKVYR